MSLEAAYVLDVKSCTHHLNYDHDFSRLLSGLFGLNYDARIILLPPSDLMGIKMLLISNEAHPVFFVKFRSSDLIKQIRGYWRKCWFLEECKYGEMRMWCLSSELGRCVRIGSYELWMNHKLHSLKVKRKSDILSPNFFIIALWLGVEERGNNKKCLQFFSTNKIK